MTDLLPENLARSFLAAKESEFFWLQEEGQRRIAFRYPRSENPHLGTVTAIGLDAPMAVSVIRIGKIMSTQAELGFYVDVPNMLCDVGRNYVVVKIKRKIVDAPPPQLKLRTSRFIVMESVNTALTVMYDNSGDHQV